MQKIFLSFATIFVSIISVSTSALAEENFCYALPTGVYINKAPPPAYVTEDFNIPDHDIPAALDLLKQWSKYVESNYPNYGAGCNDTKYRSDNLSHLAGPISAIDWHPIISPSTSAAAKKLPGTGKGSVGGEKVKQIAGLRHRPELVAKECYRQEKNEQGNPVAKNVCNFTVSMIACGLNPKSFWICKKDHQGTYGGGTFTLEPGGTYIIPTPGAVMTCKGGGTIPTLTKVSQPIKGQCLSGDNSAN